MSQLLDNFYDALEIIKETGLSDKFIVIGSWAYWIYNNYLFKDKISAESLRTTDVDIFVSRNMEFPRKIEMIPILRKHGYKWSRSMISKIDKFEKSDFTIEFLTEEKGRGSNYEGYPLERIGLNAISIRYMNLLNQDYIKVKVKKYNVRLPDPLNYGLHKLLIAQKRRTPAKSKVNKKEKDISQGIDIISKAGIGKAKEKYIELPKRWREKILRSIKETGRPLLIRQFDK